VRGRERSVSALSQVKCLTAGVPEHVAELEWFVTRRATKSHRAVNEFSNVASVQRLSPVGYIRPKRSAPRSSSLFPHVHFMPSVLCARTNALERSTDKCARGPAGFKLSSFPAGETRMCLMYYKTPFDFTYKVKVRTGKQSVGRSQNPKYFAGEIFARAFEDRDATAQLICLRLVCIELELEFRIGRSSSSVNSRFVHPVLFFPTIPPFMHLF
jgi:hypothetical protein